MLIIYLGTNYSCLSSSFLYVDQFPSSVIFFQPKKLPLVFLMVQICWQYIFSTFIHMKMSLFSLLWDMFTGHIILGGLSFPPFSIPFPKFQFFKDTIPLSSDLRCFQQESIVTIFFFTLVCSVPFPLGAFKIFLFIFDFQ